MSERGITDPTLGLRPKVYAFAKLMESKLKLNDDSKPNWKNQGLSVVYAHFLEEVSELMEAVTKRHASNLIQLEAADVALMAMMIADICGGLKDDRELPMNP